ncbi:hypothetical protein L798_00532 [Zootermopsis nevadensis]|uniref:Uncharacterized protein n=1 Tax=Zootermopsis nevadensis TaxID=136037 RepID=A0A067QXS6_ZOONE|nr:hypothetical protein L798_00532 [Zootermopsis nevadensis]
MQVTHRVYRHHPVKFSYLQVGMKSCGESHVIFHKKWNCPDQGFSSYFTTNNCIHVTTCGVHICFQIIALYGCNFVNGYINMLQMTAFYTALCGQTKYEGVFNVHNSHPWAWNNPHSLCERRYEVCFSISAGIGDNVVGPYL